MSIESIISKIQELKDEYVSYFKPVDDADIHLYEGKVPFRLPEAYLEFLRFSNGIIYVAMRCWESTTSHIPSSWSIALLV